jgi:hypothetical protein
VFLKEDRAREGFLQAGFKSGKSNCPANEYRASRTKAALAKRLCAYQNLSARRNYRNGALLEQLFS